MPRCQAAARPCTLVRFDSLLGRIQPSRLQLVQKITHSGMPAKGKALVQLWFAQAEALRAQPRVSPMPGGGGRQRRWPAVD